MARLLFFINDILFTFPEDWDDSDNLSEAELYDECIAYFEVVAPDFTYEEAEYHEPPMKVFDDFDNDGVNESFVLIRGRHITHITAINLKIIFKEYIHA